MPFFGTQTPKGSPHPLFPNTTSSSGIGHCQSRSRLAAWTTERSDPSKGCNWIFPPTTSAPLQREYRSKNEVGSCKPSLICARRRSSSEAPSCSLEQPEAFQLSIKLSISRDTGCLELRLTSSDHRQDGARLPSVLRSRSPPFGSCIRWLHAALLQQSHELGNCEPCFSNDGAKRAFGDFLVVRHSHPPTRRIGIPQDDVAALLAVEFVTDTRERCDDFASRDPGQRTHTATSTTSSPIDGGIGSLWARRLST